MTSASAWLSTNNGAMTILSRDLLQITNVASGSGQISLTSTENGVRRLEGFEGVSITTTTTAVINALTSARFIVDSASVIVNGDTFNSTGGPININLTF